ncbi:MAG: type II toxin-antitoxin system VapC family toxin [Euryarchaeota archaeon]|nr:type II toxin-antitoxin system VapC family toxin [Euryarchaeota archaeon]MDE1837903.1 type II toxin-antitoxin system VapC family toxin [Euryarchaeota archaeon]MDE1881279.1 type II toxin-antitoxin system VapC family toxin [Euryarchaeota archaeon]MDE2046259.1 type II toxin-antitoxin system VapC family toxin [Thermoplasmata archaeon]
MSGPTVVLDTNVFVAARRPVEKAHAACRTILKAVEEARLTAIVPTVTLSEVYVGYVQTGTREAGDKLMEEMQSSPQWVVQGLDLPLAKSAAVVRSETGLLLPDAIVAATGIAHVGASIVTADTAFGRAKRLVPVVHPSSLARTL